MMDKKATKGKIEKERVLNNGQELMLIKKALGLPGKTSKAKVLKAAVDFFMKTYTDVDFSDIAIKPPSNTDSEKNKKMKFVSAVNRMNGNKPARDNSHHFNQECESQNQIMPVFHALSSDLQHSTPSLKQHSPALPPPPDHLRIGSNMHFSDNFDKGDSIDGRNEDYFEEERSMLPPVPPFQSELARENCHLPLQVYNPDCRDVQQQEPCPIHHSHHPICNHQHFFKSPLYFHPSPPWFDSDPDFSNPLSPSSFHHHLPCPAAPDSSNNLSPFHHLPNPALHSTSDCSNPLALPQFHRSPNPPTHYLLDSPKILSANTVPHRLCPPPSQPYLPYLATREGAASSGPNNFYF